MATVAGVVLGVVFLFLAGPSIGAPDSLDASADSELHNPFADFETRFLPNGLKVWVNYLPGDPNVSISITTPYGSDQDPPGMEELAHFTEHMLFADHMGRTEEKIKREVEDLGASRNGTTHSNHTYYYVNIAKAHGLFALDWLYRIISPHEMAPEIVDRQREPIAVELRARPRDLIDWVTANYVNPPLLRPPGFWEREFGLETRASRDYYPYRSLQRIGPSELHWFYDTYYTPEAMTLTIVGDFDPEQMWTTVDSTFATLPSRPLPEVDRRLHDPQRSTRMFTWDVRATAKYTRGFRFYSLTAEQHQMLLFQRDWLHRRLTRRLRYGDRKATYGIRVGIYQRGPATHFMIRGEIKKSEIHYAREVIEEELELLRTGGLSTEEFVEEREALVRRLYTDYVNAEDLTATVRRYFFDRKLHRDFPDLIAFYESQTIAQVTAFSREHFVPERESFSIHSPMPISQELMIAVAIALLWITLRLARRILLKPIDMTRIRYVARFKIPFFYLVFLAGCTVAVLAILARLGYFGYIMLWQWALSGIEGFWIQYSLHGLALMGGALLLLLILGQIPSKILVFDDQLCIKNLLYGSRRIDLEGIEEVSLRRLSGVWFSRRLLGCRPLTLGIFSPGLYLRLRDGKSWFFRVRDTHELHDVIWKIMQGEDRPIARARI